MLYQTLYTLAIYSGEAFYLRFHTLSHPDSYEEHLSSVRDNRGILLPTAHSISNAFAPITGSYICITRLAARDPFEVLNMELNKSWVTLNKIYMKEYIDEHLMKPG
jgi:C4-dicarboxylate transporter